MKLTRPLLTSSFAALRATPVVSFPVPKEYQRIHQDLYQFLTIARDIADVETTHRSYTMTQGVFQVFRRRLDVKDAILFSNSLPAGIRALFVAEWDLSEARQPFTTREEMTKEVQSLRPSHNFAPDSAIADVALALRRTVEDPDRLDKILDEISPEAKAFWKA